MPVSYNQSIAYSKNGVPFNRSLAFSSIDVAEDAIAYFIRSVPITDTTLDLGTVSTIGFVILHNLATVGPPPAAVISSITQAGTPGTTQDDYVVVTNFPDGSASVSAQVSTALANATLDSTNYNIITWGAVSGSSSYDVYRVIAAGTPATLGKIATGATSPLHDTGLAGGGQTATEIDSQFVIEIGPTSTYDQQLRAGEDCRLHWKAAAIHVRSDNIPTLLEYWISPAPV